MHVFIVLSHRFTEKYFKYVVRIHINKRMIVNNKRNRN